MPPVIWTLLGLIWTAASPALKAAALTELKTLEVLEAHQPFLLLLIAEAEKLLAAA